MTFLQALSRWFRPPPVATAEELRAFIDSRSAFIAQKCVVEYARARTGVLSSKLFQEEAFRAALTESRWTTYAVVYADVTEMMEGLLRHRARLSEARVAERLMAMARRTFAEHGLPEGAPHDFWEQAEARLEKRLSEARLHAPKPVKEIPKTDIEVVFAGLPIHENLRGHDFELIQNNLRTNLVRVHEDFIAVADLDRLARDLEAG